MEETLGAVLLVQTPSEMSFSRISQAKMVGLSLLYDSILATTSGVATFGLDPPIIPGVLVPETDPSILVTVGEVCCSTVGEKSGLTAA